MNYSASSKWSGYQQSQTIFFNVWKIQRYLRECWQPSKWTNKYVFSDILDIHLEFSSFRCWKFTMTWQLFNVHLHSICNRVAPTQGRATAAYCFSSSSIILHSVIHLPLFVLEHHSVSEQSMHRLTQRGKYSHLVCSVSCGSEDVILKGLIRECLLICTSYKTFLHLGKGWLLIQETLVVSLILLTQSAV